MQVKTSRVNLSEKAKTLPNASGCYFMKNKVGEIIYVGKAKKLKERVKSYFDNSVKSPKTEILVKHIYDFDFMLTNSEVESLILENNLIKKHIPKYNIRLKDDRSYPYLVVDNKDPYARILYLRRPKKKKNSTYLGPFPHGMNIHQIVRLIVKTFGLRDCTDHEFKNRKTPCILYQIHQCSAPCVGKISEDDYKNDLKKALSFFQSSKKSKIILNEIEAMMIDSADNEEFEKAAQLRDNLQILNEFHEKRSSQDVESLDQENVDIISYYEGEEEVDMSIYLIRSGALLGHKNFHFSKFDTYEEIQDEVIRFLLQYYYETSEKMPELLITPFKDSINQDFEIALQEKNEIKIKVQKAKAKFKNLIDITHEHARESQQVRNNNKQSVFLALDKLKSILQLKDRPRRIECFDVAIWQGDSPTASQVVYHDGESDKKSYRHYHLTKRPEGNNDFAMMEELLTRRIDNGNLPDLFVIDGGKAQVNTVLKVMKLNNIDIPVIGIAKSKNVDSKFFRTNAKTDERLIIPNRSNPYVLGKSSSLFRLIVSMRDEAHRFSRVLHHKTESKRVIKSWIDEIPLIQEKEKQKMRKKLDRPVSEFKMMDKIELKKFFDLSEKNAQVLLMYLRDDID